MMTSGIPSTVTGSLLQREERENSVLNIELGPTRVIIYLELPTQILNFMWKETKKPLQ